MEGTGSGNSQLLQQVAPFVIKTYEMVNEPKTDSLIRWGRGNNSFLVLDPSYFSHLLLPSFFKHSNFSSFVRQLNTYGFRKVDPDNWEFAHEAFLRGQIHLLPLIIRRKKRVEDFTTSDRKVEFLEEGMHEEVRGLREEQKSLDEEIDSLSKRLQVTERRPHQMMSFLFKVAQDPEFLPRFVLSKKEQTYSLPPLPQSLELGSCDQFSYDSENDFPALNSMPVDHIGSGGNQKIIFSPEFGASETTVAAYPFSLLGNVFF